MATVSVIIPAFQGERFIDEAVESVLGQTHSDLELVVVDDGSTDGTAARVSVHQGDGRVRLIRHESNRGIAAARNTGIRASNGRFVGFLDQDDLWRPDKLAVQMDIFARGGDDVGVVFSNVEIRREGSRRVRFTAPRVPRDIEALRGTALLERLLLDDFLPIGSALVRRECFDKVGHLDETILSGSDDFDLFVRLAPVYRFGYASQPLTIRRWHDANFTDSEKMVPDALKVLERTVSIYPELAGIESRARSAFEFGLARDLHAKGRRGEALRVYRRAVSARPQNIKAALAMALCLLGPLGDVLLAWAQRFSGGGR